MTRATHASGLAVVLALVVGVLIGLACVGRHAGVPAVDAASTAVAPSGTISGIIHGPEGMAPVAGRVLELINVDTGERKRARTNQTGGFTVTVNPGTYRLEVTLRDDETILKQPSVITVNTNHAAARADIVVRALRLSRPRTPHPADPSLGSPIA